MYISAFLKTISQWNDPLNKCLRQTIVLKYLLLLNAYDNWMWFEPWSVQTLIRFGPWLIRTLFSFGPWLTWTLFLWGPPESASGQGSNWLRSESSRVRIDHSWGPNWHKVRIAQGPNCPTFVNSFNLVYHNNRNCHKQQKHIHIKVAKIWMNRRKQFNIIENQFNRIE